jgi:hypothetical protein
MAAHTGGLGLQDAAVKLALTPSPCTGLNVDFHMFRTARPGSLSTRELANELDLTLTHRLSRALTVTERVFLRPGQGRHEGVGTPGGERSLGFRHAQRFVLTGCLVRIGPGPIRPAKPLTA